MIVMIGIKQYEQWKKKLVKWGKYWIASMGDEVIVNAVFMNL